MFDRNHNLNWNRRSVGRRIATTLYREIAAGGAAVFDDGQDAFVEVELIALLLRQVLLCRASWPPSGSARPPPPRAAGGLLMV